MKQTHEEFVIEFNEYLKENISEFINRNIKFDDNDIGVFIESLLDYYVVNDKDEFTNSFFKKYHAVIGDLSYKSQYMKKSHPYSLTLEYKGKLITMQRFGKSIYQMGVIECFDNFAKTAGNSFLLPNHVAQNYVKGDRRYRDLLLSYLNFQTHRSWTVIWAKTDWIKFNFPNCYQKMMLDGEFLSIEELEEKMKEENDQL